MKSNKSLKEIKVVGNTNILPPGIIEHVKDTVIEYITNEIHSAEEWSIKSFINQYLDRSVIDTFESFIIDQMIFNHYTLYKNGNEVLVSHNTDRDLIDEKDIVDYVDENPKLQTYLKNLLRKFYFENIDIPCLTQASIRQALEDNKQFNLDGDRYGIDDVYLSVEYAMENSKCGDANFDGVLYDYDFNSFLQQEFNQTDVINESEKTVKKKLNENETAYHGSSNYFTSFKKEGIGGGTGAQVYGWGLYFGKDPQIAKTYTTAGPNSSKTKTLFQGKTAEELGFQYENEIFFGLPSGISTAQEYVD